MDFLEKILDGGLLKKMRIIRGKFRNKKLYFPKNTKTRPLKDNVKENIFNILEHSSNIDFKIRNSFTLDLYAGTGSFGLECLSRGSSHVFFVEKDSDALTNLKRNIINLNIENNVTVYSQDVLKFFQDSILKKKIDLIFLDPPYKNEDYKDIFKIIKKKDILKKKHIFLLHREKGTDHNVPEELDVIETRVYGRSEIFFLRLF